MSFRTTFANIDDVEETLWDILDCYSPQEEYSYWLSEQMSNGEYSNLQRILEDFMPEGVRKAFCLLFDIPNPTGGNAPFSMDLNPAVDNEMPYISVTIGYGSPEFFSFDEYEDPACWETLFFDVFNEWGDEMGDQLNMTEAAVEAIYGKGECADFLRNSIGGDDGSAEWVFGAALVDSGITREDFEESYQLGVPIQDILV